MRIGIVCPYSFDAPGGVQFHIRDVAQELISRGHDVSVLAPGEIDPGEIDPGETSAGEKSRGEESRGEENRGEGWLTLTGKSVSIPFNGSVARLAFGPYSAWKVRKWLKDGNFDVVHAHEPETPSLGLLSVLAAKVPVVGTFHAAMAPSKLRHATSKLVEPVLRRLDLRIAVSEEAKRTLVEHHGGDAMILPNGVFTQAFCHAKPVAAWEGTEDAPTVVFLGRLDEPRKGLPIFAEAAAQVLKTHPHTRFLVAGRGGADSLEALMREHPDAVTLLGEITDEEKASLLKGATAYVAPQTGGESFGIVLVEAMAAGTAVVASDIPAFAAVLDDGQAGALFNNEDAQDLANNLVQLLDNPELRKALAASGNERAKTFDWRTITDTLEELYADLLRRNKPEL